MKQLLAAFLIVFAISCQKGEFAKGVPACMKQKIRKMERDGRYKGGAILRYLVDGKVYFEIPPFSIQSEAIYTYYNSDCEKVCSEGGFLSRGECYKFQNANPDTIYIIQ